jgi:hypothetical protein
MAPTKIDHELTKRWVIDHFIHDNPAYTLVYNLDEIHDSIHWDETDDGKVKGNLSITINNVRVLPDKEFIINGPQEEDGDDCTEWKYFDQSENEKVVKGIRAAFQKRAKFAIHDYLTSINIVAAFVERFDEILGRDNFAEKLAGAAGNDGYDPVVHVEICANTGWSEVFDFSIREIGQRHD